METSRGERLMKLELWNSVYMYMTRMGAGRASEQARRRRSGQDRQGKARQGKAKLGWAGLGGWGWDGDGEGDGARWVERARGELV